MEKVLVGFIMDGKSGGIDKYLLNFLRCVNDDDVKIDFLTNQINPELQSKLHANNSKLFEVTSLKHPFKQYRQICDI